MAMLSARGRLVQLHPITRTEFRPPGFSASQDVTKKSIVASNGGFPGGRKPLKPNSREAENPPGRELARPKTRDAENPLLLLKADLNENREALDNSRKSSANVGR